MKLNLDHLTEAELIELNRKLVERLRLIRQICSHTEETAETPQLKLLKGE